MRRRNSRPPKTARQPSLAILNFKDLVYSISLSTQRTLDYSITSGTGALPVMPTNELVLCYLVMLLMWITPPARLPWRGLLIITVVARGGKGFPSEIKKHYKRK